MFTDPSLILARVRHRHEPARPAAFVVVPQDHGIRFALEGPDPAQDMQWDRRYLSREQALDANTFLCSSDPSRTVDLAALARQAESDCFIWSVGRHEPHEGMIDLTYHGTLDAARRRATALEVTLREERELCGGRAWFKDVIVSTHRVED